MQHLNGKIVVITGGGSGKGREAARLCSAAGARVALLDADERGMSETLNDLKCWNPVVTLSNLLK